MLKPWMKRYFGEDGLERVEAAVHRAEKRTRGEIVPVLARRSAAYGHVPWVLGLLLYAVLPSAGTAHWDALLPWGAEDWVPLLNLGLAALGGTLLGRRPFFLRLLTPARDLEQAVHLSAEATFYRLGLRKTRESTGILLYVSLAEHRAVVLADHGIAAKVPASTWNEVCADLLQGAAAHDLAAGFENAIARCADILAQSFPARRHNRNELPNRLCVVEETASQAL
jgi:putative membrane protein